MLIVSTLAFTVCFMVWMMFGDRYPDQKDAEPQRHAVWPAHGHARAHGLAHPRTAGHLDGSLRWAHRHDCADGGDGAGHLAHGLRQRVLAILVIGLFVGLAGGGHSVGTPYVARWFPKQRQGMAMGVYGAGNSGAAVNKFVAPCCWWPLAGPWCRRCTRPSCWAP